MSLVRLLTCGKSLVGVQNAPNGYRVTRQRLLPQFGPSRNPFSNKTKSDGEQAQGALPQDTAGLNGSGAPRALSSSGGLAAASVPGVQRDHAVAGEANNRRLPGILWSRAVAPFRAMGAKVSGWFGRARAKAAKPAIPRFSKLPVQGELSLDSVRVVRNDLSDADLEVVPARKQAARARPATMSRDEPVTSPAESDCDRVTDPVSCAGKT